MSVALNRADVRLDRGHLTLGAIAMGATVILTNPLHATIISLAIAFGQMPRGIRAILVNAVFYAAMASLAATVASELRVADNLTLFPRIVVLITLGVTDLIVVAIGLSLLRAESIRNLARLNFTPSFFSALAYMALASLLISYV